MAPPTRLFAPCTACGLPANQLAQGCGEVKRPKLAELANPRNNGLVVFDIKENDALWWVAHTNADREMILVTRKGMSIRSSGRGSLGVTAIDLSDDNLVASVERIRMDVGPEAEATQPA